VKSCFTAGPRVSERETHKPEESDEYTLSRKATREIGKQFTKGAAVHNQSMSASKGGISRLPPSVSTTATKNQPHPDATEASQVTNDPNKGTRDNHTSVGGVPTSVWGHSIIVPKKVCEHPILFPNTRPSPITGSSHGSTGPASTHL